MKLLLALILAISVFASPSFAFTTSSKFFPAKCGDLAPADAPWKRSGGFCDAVDNLKSLADMQSSAPAAPEEPEDE